MFEECRDDGGFLSCLFFGRLECGVVSRLHPQKNRQPDGERHEEGSPAEPGLVFELTCLPRRARAVLYHDVFGRDLPARLFHALRFVVQVSHVISPEGGQHLTLSASF